MSQPTLESLQKQIDDLSAIVKKQSALIAKTGEALMDVQVSKQKYDVRKLSANPESDDFATNEDLVQLVGELQGQLETIEDRSIARLANAAAKDEETLSPLLNSYGEEPEDFPETPAAFKKLSDLEIVKLSKFYELIPPSLKEQAEFEELLEQGKVEALHLAEKELTEADLSEYSKDDLEDYRTALGRYLGLRL